MRHGCRNACMHTPTHMHMHMHMHMCMCMCMFAVPHIWMVRWAWRPVREAVTVYIVLGDEIRRVALR